MARELIVLQGTDSSDRKKVRKVGFVVSTMSRISV